ncbi:hypothetical protein SAMN02910456_01023 [Ruminococcaceae bacterium YRB3002]|nr:hypothetical protein SAMN02910456_01023 [Ruminococcaceae bacterium YRB3002]
MSRILRSMFYRLTHDKIVWAILIVLVIAEMVIYVGGFSGLDGPVGLTTDTLRNHTYHDVTSCDEDHEHSHDHNHEQVMVNYEEEDPLAVNKITQSVVSGIIDNVPGYELKYEASVSNVASVSIFLAYILILIFIADAIFVTYFFGDMFNNDAIRNMVSIKTCKEHIYLSALMINTLVCIVMYLSVFSVIAVYTAAAGLYPLIYVPCFVAAILIGLLITVTLNALMIFILFMVKNAVLTAILIAMFCTLTWTCYSLRVYPGMPFETEYVLNENEAIRFYQSGYRILGDKEWYIPVDGFEIGRAYVPSEDITFDFLSEEPNRYYPGEAVSIAGRTAYRANIMMYPCEIMMWFIYPMYRDGLMTRYAILSGSYLVILVAAGALAVRKRNYN